MYSNFLKTTPNIEHTNRQQPNVWLRRVTVSAEIQNLVPLSLKQITECVHAENVGVAS
jgi:hypothetical protein